jgi:hypothetical protein
MNISPQTNLSSPVHSEQRTITTTQNTNTASSKDLASVSTNPAVKVSLSVSENAQAASNASLPHLYSRISVAKGNQERLYVDDDQREAPFEKESKRESIDGDLSDDVVRVASDDILESESNDQSSEDRLSAERRAEEAVEKRAEKQQEEVEQQYIAELKARDQEVKAHEQAHRAVGGQYAGAASYTYQSGPDGVRYAVGGEVSIDISPVPNDPAATITKMSTVKAAAYAPAEPSAQDRAVATEAQRIIAKAQAELAEENRAELEQANIQAQEKREAKEKAEEEAESRRSDREAQSLSIREFQKIASLDPNANTDIDALI